MPAISPKKHFVSVIYTVAGKAIDFALEQPLHVVTLACSASGISKQQLEYMISLHTPSFLVKCFEFLR
ncbi:MAG: hypothetical protein LBJ00_16220, partial [Planctomycetaceae bacterium]|nr:hypothetical protein [Planctomycetaceae bacterium]